MSDRNLNLVLSNIYIFQVDLIIATFVSSGDSLTQLKQLLGEKGKKVSVIANIQTEEGFHNFDDIITVRN